MTPVGRRSALPPAGGAHLSYAPAHTHGIVGRELRRILRKDGVAGAVREIAVPLGRAAVSGIGGRRSSRTFLWEGRRLPYLTLRDVVFVRASAGPLGLRLANVLSKMSTERSVEVPIALEFARPYRGSRVLEVGNVLGSYIRLPERWEVIDRHELSPGIRNDDIASIDPVPVYDAAISISTLEHVGWDEPGRDSRRFLPAIANLCRSVRPGGRALLTVPLHYNPTVEHWGSGTTPPGFDFRFFGPSGRSGSWVPLTDEDARGAPRAVLVARYFAPT